MNFNIFFTNDCNLNCRYCYEGEKQKKYISKDVLDQVLEFMERVSKGEGITVTTHGGEPLLAFQEIQYFIEKAKKRFDNICFKMTTNGTLLDETKLDFIEKNYNNLSISIDGNQKGHDANRVFRDGTGSFDLVTKNYKKIKERDIELEARMTINPYNYMHVYEGVRHLIEMGFTRIMPIPDVFTKEWTEEMLQGFKEELKKIVDYISENRMQSKIDVGLIDTVKCKTQNTDCDGGITTFTIDTSGEIYPCILCNGNERYCIGNVKEGIDREKLDKIHAFDQQRITICEGCERYNYCRNTRCKLVNDVIEGNPYIPIPVQCRIENIVVELDEYVDKHI